MPAQSHTGFIYLIRRVFPLLESMLERRKEGEREKPGDLKSVLMWSSAIRSTSDHPLSAFYGFFLLIS